MESDKETKNNQFVSTEIILSQILHELKLQNKFAYQIMTEIQKTNKEVENTNKKLDILTRKVEDAF